MRFTKFRLGKDSINPKFTTSTSSPASTFGGGGDVHLNTTNGKIFKKDNKKGWVEIYDLVTAAEAGSFESLTVATGLTITAAGDVNEPAIKIGNGVNGFYQVSGTQLGVSISDALATVFDTEGVKSDSFKPRVPLGTLETGVTRDDVGNGRSFITTLTVAITDAFSIADNAALAVGVKLFTFPAGAFIIKSAYMSMAVTSPSAESSLDTPDVGLGTVVASGANALLSAAPAGSEDILTGQTATDANGTATVKTVADQVLALEVGDSHDLFFNVADTWADDTGGDLTCDVAGTVTIEWAIMD